MNKQLLTISLTLILLINFVSIVSAITGIIGNARTILRADKGDTIERYILVKNVPDNNVPLDIKLFAEGDLKDSINIKDETFTLQAGEEKKAYFTITVSKTGTTESQVNVQFTPQDGKIGVFLSSTIIVIEGSENTDTIDQTDNTDNTDTSLTGNPISNSNGKSSTAVILLSVTALIFIILLVLIVSYMKKINNKKRINKGSGIKSRERVKVRG